MSALFELIRDFLRGETDPVWTGIVFGVLLVGGFLVYCVRIVREGEQAAVLRFGRFRRAVGPGFVVIGPPWRSLQRVHIRQTSLRLAPQAVMLRDGIVFNVTGVLVYRIADVYKALFEIANLHEAMGDVGAGKLREVVSGRTADEMWDIQGLRAAIMERLHAQEEQWGVVVIDFLLVNVEPAGAAQQLYLLEELARRRVDAARITLEGFQRLAAEVGLPPRSDSPLWAALAGMSVTAAVLPESGGVGPGGGAPDGSGDQLGAALDQQLQQFRADLQAGMRADES